MQYDINAIGDYMSHCGLQPKHITPEIEEMFAVDENGEFLHDIPTSRSYVSRHPKRGRHIPFLGTSVYVVQSSKKLEYNGACEYRPYGTFFTYDDAKAFVKAMGFSEEDVDIIDCVKQEFRKSIWGWDVDGSEIPWYA